MAVISRRRYFQMHFLEWKVWVSLKISPKFVLFLRVQLTIFQHFFQIMAWRRPGDKPLSDTMMVSLMTHICVTRPQWVNKPFIIFTILFSYSFHTTVPSANRPFHPTTIFTLAHLLPLSLAHLPHQKHHLNLLSCITIASVTHTLASFWRKQSCFKF